MVFFYLLQGLWERLIKVDKQKFRTGRNYLSDNEHNRVKSIKIFKQNKIHQSDIHKCSIKLRAAISLWMWSKLIVYHLITAEVGPLDKIWHNKKVYNMLLFLSERS